MVIKLYVDDEPFSLDTATLLEYERALDMKHGWLDRSVVWETPAGKQVRIKTRRMVSMSDRHVAAVNYEVTVLNASAPVVLVSRLVDHAVRRIAAPSEEIAQSAEADDPRLARTFRERVLVPEQTVVEGNRVVLGFVTKSSRLGLGCGMDHTLETENRHTIRSEAITNGGEVIFSVEADAGKPVRLHKYIAYHTAAQDAPHELRARTVRTLDRVVKYGFEPMERHQREFMADFWQRADIEITGGAVHRRLQQCIRWNLFQLCQATARVEGAGVPAKGLTGQAYEGHYFWDMEIYVMPFLVYTAPHTARNLLQFRHSMLDKARARARELSQKGAMFPWRTINGDEASAYYAAGTAQFHINAAIAYAIRKYAHVTGDVEFLYDYGAEMLVETARLWYDLGFFSDRQGGKFCIHGVTGPDEYTTVVNNNAYTNLMARENLWYAAEVVERMQQERPKQFVALAHDTALDANEPANWKRAADNMFIPYDERTKINPQDENFLDREVWDVKNTPKEKFPLLLHYHPLVIYRHQVIKQADLILAMFLLGDEFSLEQKKRNFDYYDPLTTGDSSLSACIQAIIAAELGYDEATVRYLRFAVLMDLADVGGNVRDGVHVASIGGTWMAMVNGLAGMRDYDGHLSFRPTKLADRLRLRLTFQGRRLEVNLADSSATYTLLQGEPLTIRHGDEELRLAEGKGITRGF
jgi:alpha,alpha-trehalose phosphorylase